MASLPQIPPVESGAARGTKGRSDEYDNSITPEPFGEKGHDAANLFLDASSLLTQSLTPIPSDAFKTESGQDDDAISMEARRLFSMNPLDLEVPQLASHPTSPQFEGSPLKNEVLPSPTDLSPSTALPAGSLHAGFGQPVDVEKPDEDDAPPPVIDSHPTREVDDDVYESMANERAPAAAEIAYPDQDEALVDDALFDMSHDGQEPSAADLEGDEPPTPTKKEPRSSTKKRARPRIVDETVSAAEPPPQKRKISASKSTPKDQASSPAEDDEGSPDLLGGLEAELDRQATTDKKHKRRVSKATSEVAGDSSDPKYDISGT